MRATLQPRRPGHRLAPIGRVRSRATSSCPTARASCERFATTGAAAGKKIPAERARARVRPKWLNDGRDRDSTVLFDLLRPGRGSSTDATSHCLFRHPNALRRLLACRSWLRTNAAPRGRFRRIFRSEHRAGGCAPALHASERPSPSSLAEAAATSRRCRHRSQPGAQRHMRWLNGARDRPFGDAPLPRAGACSKSPKKASIGFPRFMWRTMRAARGRHHTCCVRTYGGRCSLELSTGSWRSRSRSGSMCPSVAAAHQARRSRTSSEERCARHSGRAGHRGGPAERHRNVPLGYLRQSAAHTGPAVAAPPRTTRTTSEYNEMACAERDGAPSRTFKIGSLARRSFGAPYLRGSSWPRMSDAMRTSATTSPVVGPWLESGHRPCAFRRACTTTDNVAALPQRQRRRAWSSASSSLRSFAVRRDIGTRRACPRP